MKLIDQLNRKPFFVAFGQAMSGGGITSVDLVANRNPTAVTLTASDGSAAPIPGADTANAGVMTAADKIKLDSLDGAGTRDFASRTDAVLAFLDPAVNHLRTAGYNTAGDGGGALYVRKGSQPTHNLYLQTADGAYWELVPEDGRVNLHQAGAVGDGVTDDWQAMMDAIEAFETNVTTSNRASSRIVVPAGNFFIGARVDVHSTVIIEGQGVGAAAGGASVLTWPDDTPGFVIQRHNTTGDGTESPNDPNTKDGAGTIISNLKLVGGGTGGTADGIWLRARATIDHCLIADFPRDGIHIEATSGGAVEGNANNWRVQNCRLIRNGRHGLYVNGADTNAGSAIALDTSSNGRWGIYDSSFLGNTYIDCHAATNGLATVAGNTGSSFVHYNGPENGNTNIRYAAHRDASEADLVATVPGTNSAVWIPRNSAGSHSTIPTWLPGQPVGTYFTGGPFASESVNARNILLGCYTEQGQGPTQIVSPTQVIGGLQGAAITGSGLAIEGNKVEVGNLLFGPHSSDSRAGMELDIRRFGDGMIYANVSGDHTSGTQLMAWYENNKTWAVGKHGNLNSRIPFEITTDLTTLNFGRSAAPGGGYVILRRGVFLGTGGNARNLTYGSAAPTSGAYGRGDIVLNNAPSANGSLGWVCVTAGSPGTWEALAVVTKTAWDALEARVTALESA